MGRRGKVVLARITNERKRRETLRKRKAGLLKKVSELTTLCDLEAAVVVYSRGDIQPTVWPSTSEARATISKFLRRPELERKARSHTTKSLTAQKCKRLKNKVERLRKKNDKRIMQALITLIYDEKTRIQDLDSERQKKLRDFADERKKELLKHIRRLKRKEQQATLRPQALPPILQMPPEAASGQNINGLAVGRNSTLSAVAAHGQLMNDRGMTRLAPPLYLYLQTTHPLVMPPYKAAVNSLDMIGRATSDSHGQEMTLRSMKQVATIPLPRRTPNPLVKVPNNNSTENTLNTTGIYGQTNIGGVMQHTLPSPLFMPPTAPFTTPIQAPYPPQAPPLVTQFPSGNQPTNSLNIYDFVGGRNISSPRATTQGQLMNVQGMTQLAPTPLSLSQPTPDLIVMPTNNLAENRLNMTGRFYGQTNIGHIMQHPLPSPSFMPSLKPFAISNVQSMANSLDTTNDGFINASTKTMNGDDDFEERIQHASPPFLPLEFPSRLGLPPVSLMQHDASGIDMLSNENRWNTIGFTKPGITSLDQSSFGDIYSWNANEFPEPATPGLISSNLGNGTSNSIWDDLDTAFEVNIAPYWWRVPDNVVKLHGVPKVIISDRDAIFVSTFWKELFKAIGTQINLSTAYHPQTDGQTERVNQCLEMYLRCVAGQKPTQWSHWLPMAELWYNTCHHSAISMSPYKALNNQDPPSLHYQSAGLTNPGVKKFVQDRVKLQQLLREITQGTRKNAVPYRQASVVMRRNQKLSAKFFGSYKVLRKMGNVAYQIALPPGSKIHDVFHVSQLKKRVGKGKTIQTELPGVGDEGELQVEPMAVLDGRLVKRGNAPATLVLIQWNNGEEDEATWEFWEEIHKKFPKFDPGGQESN